jgi:hypothetical protein
MPMSKLIISTIHRPPYGIDDHSRSHELALYALWLVRIMFLVTDAHEWTGSCR